jgi:predicted GNAT family acetyltransferase
MTAQAATVRDNDAAHRYELLVEDDVVGELIYRARDDVVTLIHTEIAPQYEGHGLGEQLVAHALDDIRARGLEIVPVCPFVGAYLRRHPEYEDLVK